MMRKMKTTRTGMAVIGRKARTGMTARRRIDARCSKLNKS